MTTTTRPTYHHNGQRIARLETLLPLAASYALSRSWSVATRLTTEAVALVTEAWEDLGEMRTNEDYDTRGKLYRAEEDVRALVDACGRSSSKCSHAKWNGCIIDRTRESLAQAKADAKAKAGTTLEMCTCPTAAPKGFAMHAVTPWGPLLLVFQGSEVYVSTRAAYHAGCPTIGALEVNGVTAVVVAQYSQAAMTPGTWYHERQAITRVDGEDVSPAQRRTVRAALAAVLALVTDAHVTEGHRASYLGQAREEREDAERLLQRAGESLDRARKLECAAIRYDLSESEAMREIAATLADSWTGTAEELRETAQALAL